MHSYDALPAPAAAARFLRACMRALEAEVAPALAAMGGTWGAPERAVERAAWVCCARGGGAAVSHRGGVVDAQRAEAAKCSTVEGLADLLLRLERAVYELQVTERQRRWVAVGGWGGGP